MICARCRKAGAGLDCLTLQRDTEVRANQTHRFDLCRRCSSAVLAAIAKPPALERLKRHAPDGPPFLGLMLDVPTVKCLREGAVNARAQVAAAEALEGIE